jgi:hypothetical protein
MSETKMFRPYVGVSKIDNFLNYEILYLKQEINSEV